jgi:hypothetical protein
VGFFRWFFWVGFLLPTLLPGPSGRRERGLPGHLLLGRPLPDGAAAGLVHPGGDHHRPGRHAHRTPRTPPLLQVNNRLFIHATSPALIICGDRHG